MPDGIFDNYLKQLVQLLYNTVEHKEAIQYFEVEQGEMFFLVIV